MIPLPNRAPVTDDGNRANASLSGAVTSDGSYTWVSPWENSETTLSVASNLIKCDSGGGGFGGAGINGLSKNLMISWQIPAGAGGTDHSGLNTPNNYWAAIFRSSQTFPFTFGASSNIYICKFTFVNAASDTITCTRYIAGAGTAQTNLLATPSFDMVEGDYLAVAVVEGNGGTYIVMMRSTDNATWTVLGVFYDTSASRPNADGGAGLELFSSDAVNDPGRVDNITIRPLADIAAKLTRFYFPSSGAPPITPSYDGGWEGTSNSVRRQLVARKLGTAMTTSANVASAAVANSDRAAIQAISDPLDEGIIFGHVKGQMRVAESSTSLDARAQAIIRVLSNGGGSVRGTILAMDTSALSNEFVLTTLTNRKFPKGWASPGTVLTPLQVQAGDVLVVELGYRHASLASQNSTFRFGDAAASDLAEDESTTTDNNPWIEFLGGMIELPKRPQLLVVGQAPWTAVR